MRKFFAGFVAIVAGIAVIAQFILMLQNRTASTTETILRFFSFFTILTNCAVAVFFAREVPKKRPPRVMTAIALYIFVVGLVYQVLLRATWNPEGWQKVVDELLHSLIPLLVFFYWFLYVDKSTARFGWIPAWLLYPAVYVVYVLLRGNHSGFYPYPFLNVNEIGLNRVLVNAGFLLLGFLLLACLFIAPRYLASPSNKRKP